jgi:ATP synthase subunit 6
MFLDPLEQFVVVPVGGTLFNNVHLTSSLILLSTVCLMSAGFFGGGGSRSKKTDVVVIRDLALTLGIAFFKANIRLESALMFFPVCWYCFWVLFLSNLGGLIPYSIAVSSLVGITVFYSISFSIGILILGFRTRGLEFITILMPAGSRWELSFFMILMELSSFVARALSLSVRLFANMLSGHGLLKVLCSFIWVFFINATIFDVTSLIMFTITIMLIVVLECLISCLQAYVFISLLCIYTNDVLSMHQDPF